MKKEVNYIYNIRAFAIMCVIMLHCMIPYVSNPAYYGSKSYFFNLIVNSIARTGVPLFLMISGALILNDNLTNNIKSFYKKRLSKLLIPLLSWNIIYFLFYIKLGNNELDLMSFIKQVLNNGTAYHLWYVYNLLSIYLLAPFLKKIADNSSVKQLIFLMVLMGFGTTIRPAVNKLISPVYIYLFEPIFNGYFLFFLAGYILDKIELSKKTFLLFLVFGVVGMAISLFGNHISSSSDIINFKFNGGYDISWFLLSMAIFILFRSKISHSNRFIKSISKSSYGMYFIHVALIDLVLRYFMFESSPVILEIYLFIITFVASYGLSLLFRKAKFLN